MVERHPILNMVSHLVLVLGVLIVAFPLYITFVASTHTADAIVQTPMPLLPGSHMLENYAQAWNGGGDGAGSKAPVARMMTVSLISALVITVGKIAISLLSAFAIVYFRFPFRQLVFWSIFVTLMLPVEVRIGPTYKVVSDLGMLNTYAGLTIPLIASATATFLFRQFFLTVPDELLRPRASTAPAPCASSRTSCCPCPGPRSRRCSSSSSFTAGTSTCGPCWPPPRRRCTRWWSASR